MFVVIGISVGDVEVLACTTIKCFSPPLLGEPLLTS